MWANKLLLGPIQGQLPMSQNLPITCHSLRVRFRRSCLTFGPSLIKGENLLSATTFEKIHPDPADCIAQKRLIIPVKVE